MFKSLFLVVFLMMNYMDSCGSSSPTGSGGGSSSGSNDGYNIKYKPNTLDGHVTDAKTRRYLDDATVCLVDNYNRRKCDDEMSDHQYFFYYSSFGESRLIASCEGYVTDTFTINLQSRSGHVHYDISLEPE